MAKAYGVTLEVQFFQYASYRTGVVNAAAQLGVTAVVARIPPSFIPYRQLFRCWRLRRQLARRQQVFFTLDDVTPALVRYLRVGTS